MQRFVLVSVLVGCLFSGMARANSPQGDTGVVLVDGVLRAVWAGPGGELVTVGHEAVLLNDGRGWLEIFARERQIDGFLYGVWGSGTGTVFAVAGSGQVLRLEGSSWTVAETDADWLMGVWGSSRDDVFAVGDAGAVYHFDGERWTAMATGSDAKLLAVWGSSPKDVFAVGTRGTVLAFDGEDWSLEDIGDDLQLCSVWGTSESDVFVGGSGGVILHFDGEGWSRTETGILKNVESIAGSAPDDVYAVGRFHEIYRYDGLSWSRWATTPDTFWPTALTVTPGGDVVVVGFHGQRRSGGPNVRGGFSSGTGAILRLAGERSGD
jgi:hypothetical protein